MQRAPAVLAGYTLPTYAEKLLTSNFVTKPLPSLARPRREIENNSLLLGLCKMLGSFPFQEEKTVVATFLSEVNEFCANEQALSEDIASKALSLQGREKLVAILARRASPDVAISFLSRNGMTFEVAYCFYSHYTGQRTKELISTLERCGLEAVLNPPFPVEVMEKIFDFSFLRERCTLRCTCQKLALYHGSIDAFFASCRLSLFRPRILPKVVSALGLNHEFLFFLSQEVIPLGYFEEKVPKLTKFPFIMKLLVADKHPLSERRLLLFLKCYLRQYERLIIPPERSEIELLYVRLDALEDLFSRAEGLKPAPTLLRCITLLDSTRNFIASNYS